MRAFALVVALVLGFAVGIASAAPTRDALIRPGQSIGKIKLGMTLGQVRRTLGRTNVVARRIEYAFGGEYVELQWGASWSVGFRTDEGKLRAVRIATTKRNQRTTGRIGVGSRPRHIVAAYPTANCVYRGHGRPFPGMWIVVTSSNGRMTAFALQSSSMGFPPKPPTFEVLQVLVQEKWYSRPVEMACQPGWRRL